MIHVNRIDEPAILRDKAREWLSELKRASTKEEKEKARNHYRHIEIKTALKQMFHGKCAYCESFVNHIDYADIEHYRPKSKYEDLTFDWDNLLLSCGVCNSVKYKGDHFPEAADGGPILNPRADTPEDHLDFIYDEKTKLASVSGKTTRGVVTEKLLGLNDRVDLRVYRSIQVKRLAALFKMAGTDAEASDLLREAQEDSAEYAAFARQFK